jgi:hypothetical protein
MRELFALSGSGGVCPACRARLDEASVSMQSGLDCCQTVNKQNMCQGLYETLNFFEPKGVTE